MAGPGRARMLAAGAIILREAQRLAAPWSVQIPPTMKLTAGDSTAAVSSQVGPSYPNEVRGVRHPVYGNRHEWVDNQYRPFLAPAAVAKADAVAEEIAKSVDDFCHDLGFKGIG